MSVFSQTLAVGNDDGTDDGVSYDGSLAGLSAGTISGTIYTGGVRFTNVTIPNGAAISSATLTLYSAGADTGTVTSVTAYGVAANNAVSFSTTKPSTQTKTTASAAVSHGGAADTQYNVTVTSIAQEVLGRVGWASGNALAFVLTAAGSGSFTAFYEDFDFGSFPAQISITYTAGTVYNESVTETVTAATSLSNVMTWGPTITEAAAAATTYTAAGTFVASLTEAATAADSIAAGVTITLTLTEAASAADSLTGGMVFTATLSESVTAAASFDPRLVIPVILTEAVTAAASVTSVMAWGPTLAEALAATDSIACAATFAAALTEAGTAADSLSMQLNGWFYANPSVTTWSLESAAAGIWTPIVPTSTDWT